MSIDGVEYLESLVKRGATGIAVRVPLAVIEQTDWRAVAAMLK